MRILNERRTAAEGSYVLMKKTNKCMKMGLLAAALLAGVMMGCSNVSNSGSGDSSGSGDGGQGGGENSGTTVDAAEEYWADSTGISGKFPVAEMKVYQYRGDNPLLSESEETTYYNSDIIKNFRFYRFTGTVDPGFGDTFIQNLDNFIIAVDTATDFVYAYADITATEHVVITDVPTAFAAVEKNTEKNEKGTPFYKFDPIGYVNDNGTVTLYQKYQDEITAAGVNYFPSVHSTGLDKAEKKADGFGRSPYYANSETGSVQINKNYDGTWTLNADFEMSGLGKYEFVTGRSWTKSEKVTAYTKK